MARNLDPKCKQCRRAGEKLFLKGERCFSPKCAIIKRNYAPGQHGLKGNTRLSTYGQHLKEKQKVKQMYRLLERQFSGYLYKAMEKKGNTGEMFLQSLEFRLDNVVYRLGFAQSRDHARQLVTHGHFTVNGKPVSVPSYTVRVNDVIAVKESGKNLPPFANIAKGATQNQTPAWLERDPQALSGSVLHAPAGDELPQGLQVQLIVEYYSR